MIFIKKVIKRFVKILSLEKTLEGNGERVDIVYNNKIDYSKLDIYQKSHYKRYEFASKLISSEDYCGDFACGTGYGSLMLSKRSKKVLGADINKKVIDEIKKRYQNSPSVNFIEKDLLQLEYDSEFDNIISFETIEHFTPENIEVLFNVFYKALKADGKLIFSTPYLQQKTEMAMNLGHHLTFYIDEKKIEDWLKKSGFSLEYYKFQNYQSHELEDHLNVKDFIISVAKKK